MMETDTPKEPIPLCGDGETPGYALDCWLFFDPDWRVTGASGAVQEVLGEVSESQSLSELIGANETSRLQQCLEVSEGPARFYLANGKGRVQGTVIPSGNGYAILLRDEAALDRLALVLGQRERLAALGSTTVSAAHEINNTLSAIDSVIPLLEYEGLSSMERTKHLRNLKQEAERATDLIGTLVNLARDWHDEPEPVGPEQVLDDVRALKRPDIEERNITVVIEADTDIPSALARRADLESALLQLLSNAIEALEGTEGERRIDVRVLEEDENIVFEVSDSGPGVRLEMRDNLFQRFHTTKADHAGLGLWNARRAARENNGDLVHVADGEDSGATFALRVPRILARPTDTEIDRGEDEEPPFEDLQAMMGLRVLIVEDQQTLRTSVAEILRLYGPGIIVEAANKAEAMTALEANGPIFDVVMLDMRLPDGTGREIYESLDEIAQGLKARTVFMLGERVEGEVLDFMRRTGVPYMSKPFAPRKVIKTVSQIASKNPRKDRRRTGPARPPTQRRQDPDASTS